MQATTNEGSARQNANSLIDRLGRAFSPRFLSLGFLWSWMSCSWAAGESVEGTAAGLAIFSGRAWLPSAVFVVIGLFAMPAVLRKARRLPLGTIVIFALATCAGTALQSLAEVSSLTAIFLGALTGLGSAGLIIGSAGAVAQLDIERIEAVLPANAAVAAVCSLLISAMHGAVALAFASALPLLAGALLAIATASQAQENPQGADAASLISADSRKGPGFNGEVAAALLTNLAAFIAICFLDTNLPAALAERSNPWAALITAGASLALIVLVIGNTVRVDAAGLYRWMLPLLTCSLAASLLGSQALDTATYLIGEISNFSLLVLLGLYFLSLAHNGRIGWYTAAGVCYGSCQLGVLLGNLLGAGAAAFPGAHLRATVGCICLLSLTWAFLPWLASRGNSKATASVADDVALDDPDAPKKPDGARVLDLACDAVAAEYGLSVREREVLLLLARGRTQPYIREALLLSKNTVSTHVQHIYTKLGVHSKQELIDLVEASAKAC